MCLHDCRAGCCRGPLALWLSAHEAGDFCRRGAALGVSVRLVPTQEGGASVRFLEHPGEHCPMLDASTSACRIYDERPQRCREFPQRPTPGCLLSWRSQDTD